MACKLILEHRCKMSDKNKMLKNVKNVEKIVTENVRHLSV